MPKPRVPSNVLDLRGAYKKHAERARERENEPEPIGEIGVPPAHLSVDAAACWNEIVGLAHAGTLCAADRLIVEHGSQLLATLRADEWQVAPVLMLRWEAFLAKLGMTPADRSRVSVVKGAKTKADVLDEFSTAG